MKLEFQIADAFVDDKVAFSGNPAAVIVLSSDDAISDVTKQQIATEFNLSQTAFVSRKWTDAESDRNRGLSEDEWVIRWFSPTCEVPLCGHATFAASFVLFQLVLPETNVIKYQTNFNTRLQATREGNLVVLDFPQNEPLEINAPWVDKIKHALVGENNVDQVDQVLLSPTTGNLLVRLRDEAIGFITEVKPNFEQLFRVDTDKSVRVGLIMTQKANFDRDQLHFRTRYFAPWVGVNEDPVCGSAHTVLTPYWWRVYQEEHGQQISTFHAKQVSRRTGLLHCQLRNSRVFLKGHGRIFCTGTLHV